MQDKYCTIRDNTFGARKPRWTGRFHSQTLSRWGKMSRTIPTRVGRTTRRSVGFGTLPDHPHAGGENAIGYVWQLAAGGPSPRGWGERPIKPPISLTCPDHPHAGGENCGTGKKLLSVDGPSPRGWGEHKDWEEKQDRHRTIPTRVGRTPRLNHASPHLFGPSPRGWGERPVMLTAAPCDWTIPTRVGRTLRTERTISRASDHPHAGGENNQPTNDMTPTDGPSPRGWGEHRHISCAAHPARTIPTRVGRTDRIAVGRPPHPDHPHAGGENVPQPNGQHGDTGPSPRGWGERG